MSIRFVSGERLRANRLGFTLIGVAGVAALVGLVLPAGTTEGRYENAKALMLVAEAPSIAARTLRQPALDAGVDWSRVRDAPEAAGLSVAAYER